MKSFDHYCKTLQCKMSKGAHRAPVVGREAPYLSPESPIAVGQPGLLPRMLCLCSGSAARQFFGLHRSGAPPAAPSDAHTDRRVIASEIQSSSFRPNTEESYVSHPKSSKAHLLPHSQFPQNVFHETPSG